MSCYIAIEYNIVFALLRCVFWYACTISRHVGGVHLLHCFPYIWLLKLMLDEFKIKTKSKVQISIVGCAPVYIRTHYSTFVNNVVLNWPHHTCSMVGLGLGLIRRAKFNFPCYLFWNYKETLQTFKVLVKSIFKYMQELYFFNFYEKSIASPLWLADLSIALSLKLIIFSVITFSTLNVAKPERQSCDLVLVKKASTLFRVEKHLSGVAQHKFLNSFFSIKVNCEKLMSCKYFTLFLLMFIIK